MLTFDESYKIYDNRCCTHSCSRRKRLKNAQDEGEYGPPCPFSSLVVDAVEDGGILLCGIVRSSPTGRWLHRGPSRPTTYVLTRYGVVYGTELFDDFDGKSIKVVKQRDRLVVELCQEEDLSATPIPRSVFQREKVQARCRPLSPQDFLHQLRRGS
jgi:hypothetical protein